MKILLLYPPDRAFPAVPYASLPALAPCLKQAGHDVVLRDVNLEVFYALLKEETLLRYYGMRTQRRRILEAKIALNSQEADEYNALIRSLAIPKDVLKSAVSAIRVMRSAKDFYDPERFNKAWDDLRGGMRFFYGPNPVPSPNYPDLIGRLFKELERTKIDPVADVYRQSLVADLLCEKPDLIGVSIPFITSYYEAMKLVKHIRAQAPGIPIVIGGSLIDTYCDPMLTDPRLYELFDYGMVGECEEALARLATVLQNGESLESVPNLFWRAADGTVKHTEKKSVENLDTLPTPDFSGLPLDKYISPEPIASFQTSRGCYYGKCTFCSLSFRDNFRLRDPKLVVKDMTDINARTGIKTFLLWDSLSPPKTLRHIAEEISQRKLEFHWFAETKFEKTYMKKEFVQALGNGGCRFLQFGMESASERVLDLIEKGNKMDDVDIMLDNMAVAGIGVSVTWFIGFPTETEEEADYSYDFIQRRRHKITLSSYTGTYNLLPDQPLFYDQDRYNINIHQNNDGGYEFTYKDGSAPFDSAERNHAFLVRGDAELLKHGAYILYSAYCPEKIEKLWGFHRMGPVVREVKNLCGAQVQRTPETHITPFGRDPIKDFNAPPSPVKLVYQSMTGEVFRLLGTEMKVLNAADKPVTVRELADNLGFEPVELERILTRLVNRGLLKLTVANTDAETLKQLGFAETRLCSS